MSFESDYRKDMDSFCEENFTVSSEDMLALAKSGKKGKKRIRRRAVGTASAIILISAMAATVAAGAAGYGPMAFIFSHYIKDETTAQLAEQGYAYTVTDKDDSAASDCKGFGDTIDTDLISTTLIGIAGDTQQPRILLDARINDSEFAEEFDRFFIVTKTVDAQIYDEGNMDEYGPSYGFAVRDDDDASLYHISVDTPPAWVTGGQETVFTIESLQGYSTAMLDRYGVTEQDVEDSWNHAKPLTDSQQEVFLTFREYDIDDMIYRFVVPDNVFKRSYEEEYKGIIFINDGVSYDFNFAEYGSYEIWFNAYIDGIDPSRTPEDSGSEDANAYSLGEKLVLTIDGTEYRPHLDDNASALPWCDTAGEAFNGEAGAWYVAYHFDAADFDSAQSITLSDGETVYTLK